MSTRKVTLQMEQGRSMNFFDLEELCDDPGRDESGQEVFAVLTFKRSGFALSVRDGSRIHRIIDQHGRQARFRTIESAVERLSDVPYLRPEIVLDASTAFLASP